DMDGRQLLENAMSLAPEEIRDAYSDRVKAADERAENVLAISSRCIWGQIVADEEGWKPERNWWYFRLPRKPGVRLAEDLRNW
ncbi:MAG TPA: hypothetical protein VMJ30_03495, partial [Gemmatimonadales bacterium]|nr:hypothetical protein [Gemmatimonadales bacterium]